MTTIVTAVVESPLYPTAPLACGGLDSTGATDEGIELTSPNDGSDDGLFVVEIIGADVVGGIVG